MINVIWDHNSDQYLQFQVMYSGVNILPTDELFLFYTFILFLGGVFFFTSQGAFHSTITLTLPPPLFCWCLGHHDNRDFIWQKVKKLWKTKRLKNEIQLFAHKYKPEGLKSFLLIGWITWNVAHCFIIISSYFSLLKCRLAKY